MSGGPGEYAPPRAKYGQANAEQLKREEDVLSLRRAGLTAQEIAVQLGIAKSTVGRTLERAFKRYHDQLAADTRQILSLEVARLDRLLVGIWSDASKGHLGAIDRVLKIMERRAAMLGLDAPKKTALTDPTGEHALPIGAGPAQVVYVMPHNNRDEPPAPLEHRPEPGAVTLDQLGPDGRRQN